MKMKNQSRFLFPGVRPFLGARVCDPPRSPCAAVYSGGVLPGVRSESQARGPRIGLLLLLAACAALCNCTQVPLYKRSRLADFTMKPDRDPLSVSLREHVFFSREAASGGRAIGGGGCGCN